MFSQVLSPDTQTAALPVLAFISGFLGAGKTTCIGWLTRELMARGKRVAIIANDQSHGLIDSQLASLRASAAEVGGGCFCCRSEELVSIIRQQLAQERPDVILSEPVGSCTDLTATLLRPLRSIYRLPLRLAPLVTLLDSRRASEYFLGTRRSLAKEVGYIWRKQLEEAEAIAINKADLVSTDHLERLEAKLRAAFPAARIFTLSAAQGAGMRALLHELLHATAAAQVDLPVNYRTYAQGEALLGWVNLEAEVRQRTEFSPRELLLQLAAAVCRYTTREKMEIAHFKMSFTPPGRSRLLTVVNVTMGDEAPRLSRPGARAATQGRVLVNLRAQGDPVRMEAAVRRLAGRLSPAMTWDWPRGDAFRPAPPRPVHRVRPLKMKLV